MVSACQPVTPNTAPLLIACLRLMIRRMQNKEIRFRSRPTGMATLDNFEIVETEVPQPGDADVLVRTLYISVDPYLRGRMREGRSYVAPFAVGQVIESGAIGEVIESRSPKFAVGDIVTGMFGWRLYNVTKADGLTKVFTTASFLSQLPSVFSAYRDCRRTSVCSTLVSRRKARR